MTHIFRLFLSAVMLCCATAMAQADQCGTLFYKNKKCIRTAPGPEKTTLQGHPLQTTYFQTDIYNNCPMPVVVSIDWGDRQSERSLRGGPNPEAVVCEDSPTCRNPDPKKRHPVSSGCCTRAPQVQSCRFEKLHRSERSAGKQKADPKNKGDAGPQPKSAAAQPAKPDKPQPAELKLTRAEKSNLEFCFGDKACVDTVMKDAAARVAAEQKNAAEKKTREEQEFLEFVKKETARKQAKVDEEERMRKYHEEQNAAVAQQLLGGVLQAIQGYSNQRSATGGGASGGTNGAPQKPLTTGGASGAPQCGGGPHGGCR